MERFVSGIVGVRRTDFSATVEMTERTDFSVRYRLVEMTGVVIPSEAEGSVIPGVISSDRRESRNP